MTIFKRKSRYKIKPTKPRTSFEKEKTKIVKADEEEVSEARVVRDPGKKRRLLVIAILNSVVIMIVKFQATWEWTFLNTVLFALFIAVSNYLLLIWAFRMRVKKETFFTVLPQPSLFVFSFVLMLELIFFQRFERIFEGVLFSIVLIFFTSVLMGVFLTANVLNVSLYKTIPLLQVGQTVSFIVTLFIIYFSTYSFVAGAISTPLIFVVLLIIYSLTVYTHLSHFSINLRTVFWYSLSIGWGAVTLLLALLIWPSNVFLLSLVPVATVYLGCGIVMHGSRKNLTFRIALEYLVLFLVILFAVLFQAQWGIGGYFWSI